MDAARTGLRLFSVPEHDLAQVAATIPAADARRAPFAPRRPGDPHSPRLVSVMIHDPVTPEALSTYPDLEAVITRSDGYDHLPLDWMRHHGIAAYHLGDYATDSVAHLAVTFLEALLRRLPEAAAATRSGSWDRTSLVGRHLTEITVGVLGAGKIGTRVVRLLAALGVRDIVGHDLVHDDHLADVPAFRYTDGLGSLLDASDALTVHVPLDDTTHGLLDAAALARLPQDAVLVNTARGAVVDQAAVEAALRSGRLSGYAADVLPGEPGCLDLVRFQDLPNVLLTPHLGAHNRATIRARYERTRAIAEAVLAGRSEDAATYRVA